MKITEETLVAYAMGELTEAQMQAVDAAAMNDAGVAAELAAWLEVFAGVAESVPPVTPSAGRRDALVSAMGEPPRLSRWTDALARFLDVSAEKARGFLQAMSDPNTWEDTPFPGLLAFHVEGGPAIPTANAEIGLVKLAGGVHFPYHVHGERESVLVLQGGKRLSDGRVMLPGDTMTMGAGTGHSFDSLPGADLIYAVILVGGQTFEEPPATA